MDGLTINFFALGHTRPTLTVSHVRFFDVWSAVKTALASYYDKCPESFRTVEASWRGDNEYAEIVTLDGQIVGALDRTLTQEDVAAIWGVDRMEKRAFMNRIRGLFNIDGDLLPELTREQQLKFLRDPVRFFLDAEGVQSDAIMREIEARQIPRNAVGEPAAHTRETIRESDKQAVTKAARKKKPAPGADGQRELLLPITGGAAELTERALAPSAGRKAG